MKEHANAAQAYFDASASGKSVAIFRRSDADTAGGFQGT
jgi:hypothetical protein